jgi:hypothetical protein
MANDLHQQCDATWNWPGRRRQTTDRTDGRAVARNRRRAMLERFLRQMRPCEPWSVSWQGQDATLDYSHFLLAACSIAVGGPFATERPSRVQSFGGLLYE